MTRSLRLRRRSLVLPGASPTGQPYRPRRRGPQTGAAGAGRGPEWPPDARVRLTVAFPRAAAFPGEAALPGEARFVDDAAFFDEPEPADPFDAVGRFDPAARPCRRGSTAR